MINSRSMPSEGTYALSGGSRIVHLPCRYPDQTLNGGLRYAQVTRGGGYIPMVAQTTFTLPSRHSLCSCAFRVSEISA